MVIRGTARAWSGPHAWPPASDGHPDLALHPLSLSLSLRFFRPTPSSTATTTPPSCASTTGILPRRGPTSRTKLYWLCTTLL